MACAPVHATSLEQVYSVLARILFRPHGVVAERLHDVWQQHAQHSFVIVLQMRAGIGVCYAL